jgi:cysteinylglycine-S-conjugate dipeptidase
MFGGPAPDALAALIHLLATLRDGAGNTTVTGLDNTRTWDGVAWPPGRFRTDAGLLDGVSLLGDGTVSDMVWARSAVTVLGIDARRWSARPPPSSRTPAPGSTCASRRGWTRSRRRTRAGRALAGRGAVGGAGGGRTGSIRYAVPGPHRRARLRRTRRGDGGDHPDGVEEPLTLMHAPNESVDPDEIANMALAEALFLRRYAAATR